MVWGSKEIRQWNDIKALHGSDSRCKFFYLKFFYLKEENNDLTFVSMVLLYVKDATSNKIKNDQHAMLLLTCIS